MTTLGFVCLNKVDSLLITIYAFKRFTTLLKLMKSSTKMHSTSTNKQKKSIIQDIIDIVHRCGFDSSNRRCLDFVAEGVVHYWWNRHRWVAFGKEHKMIKVETSIIDSQSDNVIIRIFLNLFGEKLLKNKVLCFSTYK